MKLNRRVSLFAALIPAFIALSGCAMFEPKTDPSVPLEPNAVVRFTDIPVPAGFKLLAQNSYAFENAGVRVGMLRYKGKAPIDQVASFYRTQMVMYNWNLLNSIEYGQRMFNFERENESCIITLTPKGGSVLVSVSLGPISAKNTLKRADNPLK